MQQFKQDFIQLIRTALLASAFIVCLSAEAASPPTTAQPVPDFFTSKVEPILANRCVVCHGCTEAPCQLKLTSYAGLLRGSSKDSVFGVRGSIPASRMKDAPNLAAWRKRNFTPVVADRPAGDANLNQAGSIFFHAISAGLRNRPNSFQSDAVLAFYEKDETTCPKDVSEYESFIAKNPELGMPLGLPALNPEEYETLVKWIGNGTPGPNAESLKQRTEPRVPRIVQEWEALFNRNSPKHRLVGRYLFEHFAGMRFHFKESPGEYFEVVRSRAAYPNPISEIVTEIVTETANQSPGSEPFQYRLRKLDEVFVKKNHIVWNVGLEEIGRLTALFESIPWNVSKEEPQEYTGNPFHDFKSIPAAIRAKFMITHSHLMIDQMVRGSVCLGAAATYAIRDHFWVMFLRPEADPSVANPGLGLYRFEFKSGIRQVGPEISTDFEELEAYQNAFEENLRKIRPTGLKLQDIWFGENDPAEYRLNANITVFRHENIASTHYGWIGGRAMTAWVLSYSNFERLFYNLVVNFKYWGTLQHRIRTWDHMRTIRQEGEELFLSLLPETYRWKVRNQWTRGTARNNLESYEKRSAGRPSLIQISNEKDPAGDVLNQVRKMLDGLAPRSNGGIDDSLNMSIPVGAATPRVPLQVSRGSVDSVAEFEAGLRSLTNRRDRIFPSVLPSASYIRLRDDRTGEYRVYSIIANRAYEGHESPLLPQTVYRLKGEDNISVFRGVIGSHANLFFDLDLRSAGRFLHDLYLLKPDTLSALKKNYAISRSSPEFWPFMDWMTSWYLKTDPVFGARLDLGQYDNGLGNL